MLWQDLILHSSAKSASAAPLSIPRIHRPRRRQSDRRRSALRLAIWPSKPAPGATYSRSTSRLWNISAPTALSRPRLRGRPRCRIRASFASTCRSSARPSPSRICRKTPVPLTRSPRSRNRPVVIGSCTNGRLSDLIAAAGILKNRRIHPRVRCLIFPATQKIYLDAIHLGLFDIFVNAGCAVSTPTCGPCLGGHMGILADGERLSPRPTATSSVAWTPGSEVYLASPAVAAASAVLGRSPPRMNCPPLKKNKFELPYAR